MSAKVDAYGLSGFAVHGNNPSVLKGKRRVLVQALQNVKALVDNDIGVKRLHQQKDADPSSVIVGSVGLQLQQYDERLNIYETDFLLTDVTEPPTNVVPGSSFLDGRATVFSSLAGYVVPANVRHNTDFQRRFRGQGFALYDSLISNARANAQTNYGTAVAKGGAMGGTRHVVPEDVAAGEYLVYDVGPLLPEARADWSQDFAFNNTDFRQGCEKPVLRPFNLNHLHDMLGDALDDYLDVASASTVAAVSSALGSPDVDPSLLDPSYATAAMMEKFVASAVFTGVVLLQNAGIITIADNPAKLAQGTYMTKTTNDAYRPKNDAMAMRLGLVAGGRDDALLAQLTAAFYQPYVESQEIADKVSLATALTKAADAERIQDQGSLAGIQFISDLLWESVSRICAKSTSHSKQHGVLEFTIC